jgi:hypothetical protein
MARSKRGKDEGGVFRLIERTGLRKGVSGGSKPWFYVGTGLWTLRTIRRMAERKEEILISERLAPGQRIIIANGRATLDDLEAGEPVAAKGRSRKVARKAQKADAKAAAKAQEAEAKRVAKAEAKGARRRARA